MFECRIRCISSKNIIVRPEPGTTEGISSKNIIVGPELGTTEG